MNILTGKKSKKKKKEEEKLKNVSEAYMGKKKEDLLGRNPWLLVWAKMKWES